LQAVLVNQPSSGRVELALSGAFTFISTTPITGRQVFTYKAFDGEKYSNAVSVSLTPNIITPQTPLLAENDSYQITAGNTLTTDASTGLLSNDTYGDQVPRVEITRQPTSGSLSINADGSFRYSTTSDMGGTEIATYRIVLDDRQSNDAIVTFTINPRNLPPVVTDEGPIAVQAGQSLTFNVLENDSDPEGQTLYLTSLELDDPTAGSFGWNDRGDLTFTAHYLYTGIVNAQYLVSDGVNDVRGTAILDVIAPDAMTMTVRSGDALSLCDNFSSQNRSATLVSHIFREPTFGKLKGEDSCPVYYPENVDHEVKTDNIMLKVCGDTECRTVSISVEVVPGLQIFEGFSPNNDFLNETWQISGIEYYPENNVQVYNQTGDLVYEGRQYDNQSVVWDGYGNHGRYSGNKLSAGAYTYVIRLEEDYSRKGIVIIAR
ncbi:MAG: Ig-like domain-containing protein, partial [Cyclobacteriaceae bacterium]